MENLTQKYLFEPFLELTPKMFALIRSSDDKVYFEEMLPEIKNIINQTNIYFICKKSKLRFVGNSLLYDNNKLSIGFELTTKNGIKQIYGSLSYQLFFNGAIGFSIHPDRKSKFIVKYSNGSRTYPIEIIFNLFYATNTFNNFADHEVVNHEVLYVGQSIGSKNTSNAYQRILKHEKLQQILANIVENEPYNEVFILLMIMNKPKLFGVSLPHFYNSQTIDNNFERMRMFISNDSLSLKEIINITEACLIKYFKPHYNILLKNIGSTGNEKFLEKCRKYDINSISVALDTSCVNVALYSLQQKAAYRHHAKLQVHLENSRITIDHLLST